MDPLKKANVREWAKISHDHIRAARNLFVDHIEQKRMDYEVLIIFNFFCHWNKSKILPHIYKIVV